MNSLDDYFPYKMTVAKGRNKMGGVVRANPLYETAQHEDNENLQNCESDSSISKKNRYITWNRWETVVYTWFYLSIQSHRNKKIKVLSLLKGNDSQVWQSPKMAILQIHSP